MKTSEQRSLGAKQTLAAYIQFNYSNCDFYDDVHFLQKLVALTTLMEFHATQLELITEHLIFRC